MGGKYRIFTLKEVKDIAAGSITEAIEIFESRYSGAEIQVIVLIE